VAASGRRWEGRVSKNGEDTGVGVWGEATVSLPDNMEKDRRKRPREGREKTRNAVARPE